MQNATPYTPQHHMRIVTAASPFDGHDAAINIMRRIIQATGVKDSPPSTPSTPTFIT